MALITLHMMNLCAYLGCNTIMSVNPYRQLKHMFSSDPYLANSGIRNVFILKRFTKIGHYFCVSDKSVEPPRDSDSYDKLYKIRPVIEQLNRLLPKYYRYTSHLALDESSVKTESRDGMKNVQFIETLQVQIPDMVTLCEYKSRATIPISI